MTHQFTTVSYGMTTADYRTRLTPEEVARFWAKIERKGPEDCWFWTASVTGRGSAQHGQFTVSRNDLQKRRQLHLKAHRVVWELVYGPIPAGVCICHRCDVPRCCNPDHLFLGTQAENVQDAAWKDRFADKLTREQRQAIYDAPGGRKALLRLALQYNVSKSWIATIRAGKFTGCVKRRERAA